MKILRLTCLFCITETKAYRLNKYLNILFCFLLLLLSFSIASVKAGTDIKVNQDTGIDLQNEISMVINPMNPAAIIALYNDDANNDGGFNTGPGMGVSYSTDYGNTWSTTRTPPVFGHEFDPGITADSSGNIFAGFISGTTTFSCSGVFVSRSTNNGASWSQPTTVEAYGAFPANPFCDKCMMNSDISSTSPYRNRVYIAWQRDSTDALHSEIYASYTIDQANSFSAPVKVNDQPVWMSNGNAPEMAVASDGTVCIVWIETSQTIMQQTPAVYYFDKSTDGGKNFGTDTTVATAAWKIHKRPDREKNLRVAGEFRGNGFPSIAVDPSNSNKIYVVYPADPDGPWDLLPRGISFTWDSGDIYFVRSLNGGNSWSSPIVINDDGGDAGQFSPWIAVSPDGTVCVAWYDRRKDPGDLNYDVFYAASTDSGSSFAPNQVINDSTCTLLWNPSDWIGEYLGLVTDSNYAYITWTDMRAGERDIYFDKISLTAGTTGPPVTTLSTNPVNPDGENGWFINTPTITLSRNKAGTTYYQWDSSQTTWSAYSGPFKARENNHELYYFSASQGATETIKKANLKVDTTKPNDPTTVNTTPQANFWVNYNNIRVSWWGATDFESALDLYVYAFTQNSTRTLDPTVDSTLIAAPGPSSVSTTVANGTWWFNLSTKDKAGNYTNTVYSGPFLIDDTLPTTLTLLSPPSGSTTSDPTPLFTWQTNSDLSSYQFLLDTAGTFTSPLLQAEPLLTTSYTPTSSLGTGPYFWMVSGLDASGIETSSTVFSFTITSSGGGGGGGGGGTGEGVNRLSGLNRYQTAVEISQEIFSSSNYVIVATGANYPDALAGAPLADAYNSPILLTPGDSLDSATQAEINRLKAAKCFILGGTGAVSENAANQILINTTVDAITRIGGSDRYETAKKIAEELESKLGTRTTAVIATGADYPDALSVSPLAGAKGYPILLVAKDFIPAFTQQALSGLGINKTIIVGGTGVISSTVQTGLPNPVRKSGANRYATSVEIAKYSATLGFEYATILAATGKNYPDALTGGVLGARNQNPMILVDPVTLSNSPDTKNFISANSADIENVYVLGGSGAVSEAVASEIEAMLK